MNEDYTIAFTVADGHIPLRGAAFRLLFGASPIAHAMSDQMGRVNLGANAPGSYTLAQAHAPYGYTCQQPTHDVSIHMDGTVLIGTMPAHTFCISYAQLG